MTNSDGDTSSSALVLIDLQNDTHRRGAYASTGPAAHAESQNLVGHVGELLRWARSNDVPVIHNCIVSYPGRDFGGNNAPIFRMIGPESLEVGTWGAAVLDGLDAAPQRARPPAHSHELFQWQRIGRDAASLAVTDVKVAGVWTISAVEHTVRDAADFRIPAPSRE